MDRQKYYRRDVTQLKSEHALISNEIGELSLELQVIKNIIRRKQKALRRINKSLVQKAICGPFLFVVPALSANKNISNNIDRNLREVTLSCLQGGKLTCK